MKTPNRWRALTSLVLALSMIAAACGGTATDEAADELVPELADSEVAPDTDITTEDSSETTSEAAASDTTEFDLVAAVREYTSTIPEGFLAVGDIDAFKDGVKASDALVIDVREETEYTEGHIPGSVNIPIRTLAQNLDIIPTDRQVFVYCGTGFRAGLSTSALHLMGYDNVLAYAPGWTGWTEAAEEVQTEPVEAEVVGAPDFAPEMVEAVDNFLSTIPEGFLSAGDLEKVKTGIDAGAFVLDVRTDAERAEGFIPGSTHVDLRTIPDNLDKIPTDQAIITYCKSGFRAALSIPVLHILGYDDTKGFPGSWKAWTEAGEPVENL